MARLRIEIPASVDYEEKWANKVPEEERIEIPAKNGRKPKERSGEEK